MPNPILVPVVAHRVFGQRYVASGVRLSGDGTPDTPFGPGLPMPRLEVHAVVDTDHGTRRSVEDIYRLFHEGETPHYARDMSVNRLWRQADVQFVLVGIVDEMVDSHQADFLPSDWRSSPDLSGNRYDNAVNIYFFRELSGAWGRVRFDDVFVADRWDPARPRGSREDAWLHDVITVSHEIGHLFDLHHRGDPNNLMFGSGTVATSKEINAAQALFAQGRARWFRRPWFRNVPDDDEVQLAAIDTPTVRAYAGETLPTFD